MIQGTAPDKVTSVKRRESDEAPGRQKHPPPRSPRTRRPCCSARRGPHRDGDAGVCERSQPNLGAHRQRDLQRHQPHRDGVRYLDVGPAGAKWRADRLQRQPYRRWLLRRLGRQPGEPPESAGHQRTDLCRQRERQLGALGNRGDSDRRWTLQVVAVASHRVDAGRNPRRRPQRLWPAGHLHRRERRDPDQSGRRKLGEQLWPHGAIGREWADDRQQQPQRTDEGLPQRHLGADHAHVHHARPAQDLPRYVRPARQQSRSPRSQRERNHGRRHGPQRRQQR